MKTFTYKGHTWALTMLSRRADAFSLQCTSAKDLSFEDVSNLDWPSDAEVSQHAGVRIAFFDGGDDITEGIYYSVAKDG